MIKKTLTILFILLAISAPSLASSSMRPGDPEIVHSINNSIGFILTYALVSFIFIAEGIRRSYTSNKSAYLWSAIFLFILSISVIIIHFSNIYQITGIIQSITHQISKDKNDTLYFSIVTWTTLGYGDFYPSIQARAYATTQALLGYLYMGLLVSLIIKALSLNNKNA